MRGGNARKRGEKRRNLGGPSRRSSVAACSMSRQTSSHTSAGGERGGHTTEITAEHPAQTGLQLINRTLTDAGNAYQIQVLRLNINKDGRSDQ